MSKRNVAPPVTPKKRDRSDAAGDDYCGEGGRVMAPCRRRDGCDPIEYHDVMIALSKARAMASVLEQLGETGTAGNSLVHALEDGSHPSEAREWLQIAVGEALRAALDEAERGFRKSVTPEAARQQIIGGGA